MKILVTEEQIKYMLKEMPYPQSFNMETFKSIKSFSGRIKYCEEHLQRISSGSARIVYKIDNEKVLKLAKNQKGIAQNNVESEYYLQDHYPIVAKCFDSDEDGMFVEMELAQRCSPSQFKKIVGFDFNLLFPYLNNMFKKYNTPDMYIDPKTKEMMDNNEWLYDLTSLIGDYDMPIGDVTRLNSYGIVKREGIDMVVLIDYGLTNGVFTDYYARK
jgi:hypothetical protein